jgi:hypothetical protein
LVSVTVPAWPDDYQAASLINAKFRTKVVDGPPLVAPRTPGIIERSVCPLVRR